jgi:hypothetical protein
MELILVPTLRVGMLLLTLRVVPLGPRLRPSIGRRASKTCVPTRSACHSLKTACMCFDLMVHMCIDSRTLKLRSPHE